MHCLRNSIHFVLIRFPDFQNRIIDNRKTIKQINDDHKNYKVFVARICFNTEKTYTMFMLPWLCVWDCYYNIYYISVTCITRGHWDFVSIINVQSMVCANDRVHHDLRVLFVCLYATISHYHQYAHLPEGTELIKYLSGICCRVCLTLSHFSRSSSYSIYGDVCFPLTQFSCDDRQNMYFIVLSPLNRKDESLTIA